MAFKNIIKMNISLFRKPETLEKIKESQRKRYASETLVDIIVVIDELWRRAEHDMNELKAELNKLKKELGKMYKEKQQPSLELKDKILDLESRINREMPVLKDLKLTLDEKLSQIGNIVHPDVPVSKNEKDCEIMWTWGEPRENDGTLNYHHELLYKIGGFEPQAGSKIAGHRGYFLRDAGFFLNQAIINYAVGFLVERDYTVLQTPFFMNKTIMAKTAQLTEFDEQLYKVIGNVDDEEKYLIATSEQPISAFHMKSNLTKSQLPIKYAGVSTNFRKEAGGHGRDVWGTFRVHQFEKVEQFILSRPEDSWKVHQEMIDISMEFVRSLGIPYRVIDVVSGELNDAASRKFDLEGWFPALGEYRELVSCSNCTDYQSRKLEVRYGFNGEFVHMLNSTLSATSRTMCAILENFQCAEGIKVPEVLKPFLPSHLQDIIPFEREIPPTLFKQK